MDSWNELIPTPKTALATAPVRIMGELTMVVAQKIAERGGFARVDPPCSEVARDITDFILGTAAKKIRADCPSCQGEGKSWSHDDTECEYCGRPMAAILALRERGI